MSLRQPSSLSDLLQQIFSIISSLTDLLTQIFFNGSSHSDLLQHIFFSRIFSDGFSQSDLLRRIFSIGSSPSDLLRRIFSSDPHLYCDAPKPRGQLTTRQPAEYSWMLGNPTPLTKIGQSLLCTGSSTQNTTCPKQFTTTTTGPHASKIMATWAPTSILTKIYQLYHHSSRVNTLLFTQHISKFRVLIHVFIK